MNISVMDRLIEIEKEELEDKAYKEVRAWRNVCVKKEVPDVTEQRERFRKKPS